MSDFFCFFVFSSPSKRINYYENNVIKTRKQMDTFVKSSIENCSLKNQVF